jgi:hypothetical protein
MRNDVPHLLVYISSHGLGHLAQVAPVLNNLRLQLPDLRLTICSKVSPHQLQSLIQGAFTHIEEAADIGMVMASALDVLPAPSMLSYREFHSNWSLQVAHEVERIKQLAPDFVLTNVAYLPLLAAQHAGVSCAAMCSLNWADIFAAYCATQPGAAEILQQIRQAYAAADDFIRITPAMPMQDLANIRSIGSIARVGQNRRTQINVSLGLHESDKLILVSMGGITMRLPIESWARIPNVRWIVQADWEVSHPDVVILESLAMDFIDVLASSDMLLCKPGYGSFAEAACNGIPVLYVAREDWPEEPFLITWLESHGLCRKVSRAQSDTGQFAEILQALLSLPKPLPVQPTGIAQATDYLIQRLF